MAAKIRLNANWTEPGTGTKHCRNDVIEVEGYIATILIYELRIAERVIEDVATAVSLAGGRRQVKRRKPRRAKK